MIKLSRPNCPEQLTETLKDELTQRFKETSESVWSKPFIKSELLKMSHEKCCFCEAKLIEEGKYMNVEHFHHKAAYPDEVVSWDNLLPSCSRCNSNKGSHDTKKEPIIDPTKQNPKDYFFMKDYRFKSKDNNIFGKRTIEVLYLNDTSGLVKPRFEIGNKVQETIEKLLELSEEYREGISTSTRRRNRIVNGTKDILREGLPTCQYSATVATTILSDENYYMLKTMLQSYNFWDDELQNLEDQIKCISFL